MSDTTAATNDRILDLAELLDGIQEQLVLLEKQADAAKAPLDAAKSAQDAAVQALNAAVEGLNAPKLDGFRAEIDATKRHLQAALDEYSQQIDSLLTQYATMEAATRSLREQFSSALAEGDAQRVEFSRKSEGETAAITVNVETLRAKVEEIQQKFDRRCTEIASAPTVKPEDFAAAIAELRGELSAKFETAKQEVVASPGLNPRGKYDERQAYARLDMVEVNGSSYISLIDGNKNRPRKKGNIGWMVCAAGAGTGGGSPDAVLYTAQSLTTEQKAQARANIGVEEGSSSPTTTTGDMIVRGATEDERLPTTTAGRALLTAADAAAQRTAMGVADSRFLTARGIPTSGLVAAWEYTDVVLASGAISQWNDITGGGNHLTQSTAGARWTVGSRGAFSPASPAGYMLTTPITINFQSATIVFIHPNTSAATIRTGAETLLLHASGFGIIRTGNELGISGFGYVASDDLNLSAVAFSASEKRLYINSSSTTQSASAASATSLSFDRLLARNADGAFAGGHPVAAMLIYSRALEAGEIDSLCRCFSVEPLRESTMTLCGDSITFGSGVATVGSSWSWLASRALGYSAINTGVAGRTAAQEASAGSGSAALKVFARRRGNVIISFGSNDLATATGATATLQTNIQTIAGFYRTLGTDKAPIKVYVATILPRTSVFGGGQNAAGFETDRNTFNAWLRLNWHTFANGIIDIGDPSTLIGNVANTATYLADGTHPNATGHALLATLYQRGVLGFTSPETAVKSSVIASGSAVSLTTATPANVTSLSLAPGDWYVSAGVNFTLTGATATALTAGISTASATMPSSGEEVAGSIPPATTTGVTGCSIPAFRVRASVATTVYLVASATFSAGSVAAFGSLRATQAGQY